MRETKLETFAVQKHGSIPYAELRELGLAPSDITDFSATVNPFPLPDELKNLISADCISHYPDSECSAAAAAIARFHAIPREWVIVAAGVTEIIYALPLLSRKAVQFSPTYGDYADAWRRHRAGISSVPFPASESTYSRVIDKLRDTDFRILLLCNPNNPDGRYCPMHRIGELCAAFPGAVVCVDESYQEMGRDCDTAIGLVSRHRNLVLLKSLTKPFGIGGLRAGYAISSGEAPARIKKLLIPWGVSCISQRLVPALFENIEIFKRQWRDIVKEKKRLMRGIERAGYDVSHGACPFFLVRVEDSPRFRALLLRNHHVTVRDCTSFGLPGLLRIMPSLPGNNDILLRVMNGPAVHSNGR